jgi:hypothetical protein
LDDLARVRKFEPTGEACVVEEGRGERIDESETPYAMVLAIGLDIFGPGLKLMGAGCEDGLNVEEGWKAIEVRILELVGSGGAR